MKDTFQTARLVAPDTIRLVIFTSVFWEKISPTLLVDRQTPIKLAATKSSSTNGLYLADYQLDKPLELGHSYLLVIPNYGQIALDVSEATTFPDFDKNYFYGGDDLGAVYAQEATSFAVWCPLASSVILKFRLLKGEMWHYKIMSRGASGVFRMKIPGDIAGAVYQYLVTNNEITSETTDPYGKASTLNAAESVVADLGILKKDFRRDCLPVINSYCDAIIYEASVRDMSSDAHADIVHKGTFKGLAEPGRKSEGGNPAGLDYLASLGITHLQLLPIYDFGTVDETDPAAKYNWGYDPVQYFVPEGSYASDPTDPLSRSKDLQELVAALHAKGIRVVMDVVYNHVYDYAFSVFEKCVPNFFFRHKANGKMSNTSYCGDDVNSDRPMVRKYIIDCCKWWIEAYGIDGFRFDLMGILDVTTLNLIKDLGRAHDPSFILYGEGWDTGTTGPSPLGNMANYKALPEFGFFNDDYRENLKGFLFLDDTKFQAFKFSYVSSSLNFIKTAKFLNGNQTINYVECHDGKTVFDMIGEKRPELAATEKLKLVNLANASILLSYGIPFIHMGQEIGQSKWGEANTYNLGDHFNKFSYRLLDERKSMYDYFRSLVGFRRSHAFLHVYDPRVIDQCTDVHDFGENGLHIDYDNPNAVAPLLALDCFINPSDETRTFEEPSDRELLIDTSGDVGEAHVKLRRVSVPPHSLIATCLRGK